MTLPKWLVDREEARKVEPEELLMELPPIPRYAILKLRSYRPYRFDVEEKTPPTKWSP